MGIEDICKYLIAESLAEGKKVEEQIILPLCSSDKPCIFSEKNNDGERDYKLCRKEVTLYLVHC